MRLKINRVQCISTATGIELDGLACGKALTAVFSTVAAGAAITAAVTGPPTAGGGAVTAGAVAGVAGGIAAISGLGTYIASEAGSGSPDNLYIKINGKKKWPKGKDYKDVKAGQSVKPKITVESAKTVKIELMEYDAVSASDSLGTLKVKPHHDSGLYTYAIVSTTEGSQYLIEFKIEQDFAIESIDAGIAYSNDKAYFFSGSRYVRYTPSKGVDAGWALPGHWKKWPKSFKDGIDAAILIKKNHDVFSQGKAYFFKGSKYIRYTPGSGTDSGYPKDISGNWKKWPDSFNKGIDAAIMLANGKAYFFRGSEYIRYTPGKGMDPDYPKSIAENWKGWPDSFNQGIDAAFLLPNEKAYFFKGTEYIRYTPGRGVDSGYPKAVADKWSGVLEA